MGYYLWRVTGSPVRMPYQIERQEYAVAPYMIWQPVRPEPAYRNPVMRKMYVEEELVGYRVFRSFPGFLLKLYIGWTFFHGPVLTFPLLMLLVTLPRDFSWRDVNSSNRILLFVFTACVAGWTLETFYNPHYSAPATGLILLLVLIAMCRLREWGAAGLFLARAVSVICVLSFSLRTVAAPLRISLPEFYEFNWYQKPSPTFGRAAIEKQLMAMPGKQLVIVHYDSSHEPFAEWVYNEADIHGSRIIWAREMDPAENQRLLAYFKDRQVWLLEADEKPPRLVLFRR